MIEAKLLWKGSASEKEIDVEINDVSSRKIEPTIESKLEGMWKEKLNEANRKGTNLYDGISYRLDSFQVVEKGVKLTVSPIKFSVRSSLKRIPELEHLGEEYYSHGLSVAGFVVTNDGKYVFAKKSSTSASSLKTDIIGGVLEEIQPPTGEGIFNMGRKELKEEINTDGKDITEMRVVGIVRSPSTDIVIVTYTQLSLSEYELRQKFEAREDKELEGIEFVGGSELKRYLNDLGGYKPTMIQLIPGE